MSEFGGEEGKVLEGDLGEVYGGGEDFLFSGFSFGVLDC